MNNRQWKKACKKASAELKRRWPGEYEIVPAEGDETCYAPPKYQAPRGSWTRHYATPPRGLLGVWEGGGGETPEWDFKDALSALDWREMIESTDWEAEAAKL